MPQLWVWLCGFGGVDHTVRSSCYRQHNVGCVCEIPSVQAVVREKLLYQNYHDERIKKLRWTPALCAIFPSTTHSHAKPATPARCPPSALCGSLEGHSLWCTMLAEVTSKPLEPGFVWSDGSRMPEIVPRNALEETLDIELLFVFQTGCFHGGQMDSNSFSLFCLSTGVRGQYVLDA